MIDNDQVRAMSQFVARMQVEASHQATAHTALDQVSTLIPDTDWASMTLRLRGGRMTTLASTHDIATQADELQYALDEGPCVENARGHDWYRSRDVAKDHRWPRWGPRVAELGVGSLLSLQLQEGGQPIGALNLYAEHDGRFDDDSEIEFAILYAAHLAVVLASTRRIDGLTTALHTRHTVGIAQGMLIERYGLDIDRSFALLRRYSSHRNMKITDLAAQIVLTGQLPPDPEAGTSVD